MPYRNVEPGFIKDLPPAADRALALHALDLKEAVAVCNTTKDDDAYAVALDARQARLGSLALGKAEGLVGLQAKAVGVRELYVDELADDSLASRLLRSLLDDIERLAAGAQPA
jgi:hypothetical protein